MLNKFQNPTSPCKALLDLAPTPWPPIFTDCFLSPEYSLPDYPFSQLIPSLILPIISCTLSPLPTQLLSFLLTTFIFFTAPITFWNCLLIYLFIFYKFIYFIYYFWLCWVFVPACGLSLVAASGGYSSLQCAGFSLQWLLSLRSTGSRHVSFSSCGSRAQ